MAVLAGSGRRGANQKTFSSPKSVLPGSDSMPSMLGGKAESVIQRGQGHGTRVFSCTCEAGYGASEADNMGKGKSYLREEDIALCRAWMRASENPVKGAEQKAEDFWKTVYECYRKTSRSHCSLNLPNSSSVVSLSSTSTTASLDISRLSAMVRAKCTVQPVEMSNLF